MEKEELTTGIDSVICVCKDAQHIQFRDNHTESKDRRQLKAK